MGIASEIVEARARETRDAFQAKYPHYTPPPWADEVTWKEWWNANLAMHGWNSADSEHNVQVRFPEACAIILAHDDLDTKTTVEKLREHYYGKR